MSVRPSNLPPIQDMPPPGGYKKVDMRTVFPTRGPKGWQIWTGASLVIAYGFYQIGQTNIRNNEQKYHERKARYAIAPVLQAEADREYLERELIALKKEAEIMKNVEGWKVGKNPYNSGKWMPRSIDPFDTSAK
mmetsp:Transcript_27905/g.34440  ORF Transcript_27905/g.34440 Transcript_27905/m.34440 type:complete len:134 (+) Transcript_27905:61-462(+)